MKLAEIPILNLPFFFTFGAVSTIKFCSITRGLQHITGNSCAVTDELGLTPSSSAIFTLESCNTACVIV
jgi:hypothetical protein